MGIKKGSCRSKKIIHSNCHTEKCFSIINKFQKTIETIEKTAYN